jgi:hypothetical protein
MRVMYRLLAVLAVVQLAMGEVHFANGRGLFARALNTDLSPIIAAIESADDFDVWRIDAFDDNEPILRGECPAPPHRPKRGP